SRRQRGRWPRDGALDGDGRRAGRARGALRARAVPGGQDDPRARRRAAVDGGASAFGVELVRRSGLDAIQTFGGYGYMEDFRVERYLRDANTLETCWIHASARQRAVARHRFAEMAR